MCGAISGVAQHRLVRLVSCPSAGYIEERQDITIGVSDVKFPSVRHHTKRQNNINFLGLYRLIKAIQISYPENNINILVLEFSFLFFFGC